jgi:hypothetical protein
MGRGQVGEKLLEYDDHGGSYLCYHNRARNARAINEYSAELSVIFQLIARWYQACSKRPLWSSLKPASMAWPWLRVQPRPGRRRR